MNYGEQRQEFRSPIQRPPPAKVEEVIVDPPGRVFQTRRYGSRLCLEGSGNPEEAEVIFVATSVFEEETTETRTTGHFGRVMTQKPQMLRGPCAMTFLNLVSSVGMGTSEFFYTALCRWLLPKAERSKPKSADIKWGTPALYSDIDRCKKAKIVVTLGKPAFDELSGLKLKATDLEGGWFSCKHRPELKLYPMYDLFRLITQPASAEQFRVDLMEICTVLRELQGVHIPRVEKHYQVIRTSAELKKWVSTMLAEKRFVQSVDCEWAGNHHIDGKLRSIQFAWMPGHAVYVRFMDDKKNYVFDVDYKTAGDLLKPLLHHERLRYVGHHIAADFPWMIHVLGIDVWGRCILDTEFAIQCVNEHANVSLERVGMKYTDLGRYDLDLVLHKKAHKGAHDDGYGLIPDVLLIPYACADVDVVIRAWPKVTKELAVEGTLNYYNEMFNPFVTDVFTEFTMFGLPINREKVDSMRVLFHYAHEEYTKNFQKEMLDESEVLLAKKLEEMWPKQLHHIADLPESAATPAGLAKWVTDLVVQGDSETGSRMVTQVVGAANVSKILPFLSHAKHCVAFNVNSADQMRLWLYTVKGYTPIKSTANKAKGTPSVDWQKVLGYPEEARKDFTPAVDKQSLQILSDTNKDKMLSSLLDMKAVGNLCKSFLGQPDYDDDTGELTRENGLHYWIASDDRVHGQFSATETGRPRSWKPNTLNWPSYVNERIERCIGNIILDRYKQGVLASEFHRYVTKKKEEVVVSIPPIRSCVEAPEGWCITESDFQTAEIRGLAFESGDVNLIRIITEPDKQFGLVEDKSSGKTYSVRISYAAECGINRQDFSLILTRPGSSPGERVRVSLAELKRNPDGSLMHPKADLHWSLAEMVRDLPREKMIDKVDRGAAKVGNFCIAEGEPVLTGRGWIPIQDVLDCDVLWDGAAWVSHEGVVKTGIKKVRTYLGLKATNEHEVWTTAGKKIHLGEASAQQVALAGLDQPGSASLCSWPDNFPRYSSSERIRVLSSAHALQFMRTSGREGLEQHGAQAVQKMQMHARRITCCLRSSNKNIKKLGSKVQRHGAKVRTRHACVVSQLQNARHTSPVCVAEGVYHMGIENMAWGGFRKKGFRPHRQQRALRDEESSSGIPRGESAESERHTSNSHRPCSEIQNGTSQCEIHGTNVLGVVKVWFDAFRNSRATRSEHEGRMEEVQTYDIVNAGPNHRFVCSGLLVSNSSAYGATANTLERKIESDTGFKPEEGTGQKILDALRRRQPQATEFLEMQEKLPRNPGYCKARSGRVRHFVLPKMEFGVSSRMYDSAAAAQGRESRNFPMQESVAATAMRAARDMQRFARKWKLQGVTNAVLYDSCVTMNPLEEKHIWKKAHHLFMYVGNTWEAHGRRFGYSIDTEFNKAWSAKPTAQEREVLYAPPTEEAKAKFAEVEKWLDTRIAECEALLNEKA